MENAMHSTLVVRGDDRSLYRTADGYLFWLDENKPLDRSIIQTGIYDLSGTRVIASLVKQGDIVIDIGANIGYYTVLMQSLAGETGRVLAFEPAACISDVLRRNVSTNKMGNCDVFQVGLSDHSGSGTLYISAECVSLHRVMDTVPASSETVSLISLDEFVHTFGAPEKIDFIKMDVDGHEPYVLNGAWQTLERFDPVLMINISHEYYLAAGMTAWDFYYLLKDKGYFIYYDDNLDEIMTKHQFLVKCANFDRNVNIIISRHKL
ncbi:MAG: FkbM family methyltransferase [Candidatus Auribacter fodinae]|jgi:FkbM family methyltransferase|uniref:FkbM family methyltransferase n=1 Tax=Candidatus Auribacter fodinae TaxID=2093366 RepID=A0A3A4RBC7_9BACT|nr:MAG: FkbM family methyltransferase [Candidatus Auribacter fodinae]